MKSTGQTQALFAGSSIGIISVQSVVLPRSRATEWLPDTELETKPAFD